MHMQGFTDLVPFGWMDEFPMIELDEIMRQREDGQFAQLLCRVRTATCTDQDIDTLRSRGIEDDDPNYPHTSIHVYRLNVDVDEQNISKLKDHAPEDQHIVIRAVPLIAPKISIPDSSTWPCRLGKQTPEALLVNCM